MNQFNNIGWMHLIIGLEVTNNLENINCISSSEFMAGSLDAEWKILNSTPMSYLLANKLISHEIFIQKKLKNLAIKFINRMYLGGINVTLSVQIGLLQSILNLNEFITFGQKYPVKLYLFCRPLYLLKLFIIKLKLVRTFKSLILFLERLKQKTYNNKQLTYKYINQIFN